MGAAGCTYINALEGYVYGFPLVMMDVTKDVVTATPKTGEYKAPINQFGRIRTYVDPDFKDVVRISVNSLWSHAFLDLDKEPFVISVPDTKGRYIVMQALNMWTDDFASVGSRTTGTGPGNFLIAGPKWTGTAPPDVKETFRSSTRYAWVLVQMAAGSAQDFPEINALQDQLIATPLSAWGQPYTPPANVSVDSNADITATPFDQVRLMDGPTFFRRLAMAMKDNPMKTVNGWINMLNLGRYGTDYNTRAFIAYVGLGALTSDDAVYPSAFVDGDGKVLDGASKYVMHFEKDGLPPSQSNVWSISPYRENFYVRNAIERYGILSSMPLNYNGDGSLDVYIHARSPGADKEANWLPCPPSGPFNVTIRVYQPKETMLNGAYKIPPIKKVQ
jgi:hypothetical protein